MLATTFGLGFGLPGGLIGPSLFIGAVCGGIIGQLVETGYPDQAGSIGFYAMLGMGAMMAATLQAPLAALMALLELTANPNIILPGMLAVIIASMTTFHVFRKESVFITLLKARGLDYQNDPVTQSLRRVGVASVMNTNFGYVTSRVSVSEARQALAESPEWLLIRDSESSDPEHIILAADLVRHINSVEDEARQQSDRPDIADEEVHLMEIPAQRYDVSRIHIQATLQEALEVLKQSNTNFLFVVESAGVNKNKVSGVVSREAINSFYQY